MVSEIKFLQTQINKTYYKISEMIRKIIHSYDFRGTMSKKYRIQMENELDELKERSVYQLDRLSNFIIVYLEKSGYFKYLEEFKNGLEPKFKDEEIIFNSKYNDNIAEVYSPFLSEIRSFLSPFPFWNKSEIELALESAGVEYLENILESTAQILYNIGKTPKSEVEVYRSVKFVIEAVFPNSTKASSNFLKIAKEYKPDILIPDIKAAVEYKYADKNYKLKNQIDQIFIDQSGYQGDQDYEIFYAVFYVTDDFWGKPKFRKVWNNDKSFPDNWKSYYIVGR